MSPWSMDPAGARPSSESGFKYWLLAIRPRTLTIAIVPVLVGTSLSWSDTGSFAVSVLVATLIVAVLIQVGTNLHNDVADFERGGDDPATRLGPPRVTAQGWLPPATVRLAAQSSFASAFLVGCYLAWIGGWPILAIGLIAIAAGLAYTSGPRPIAYTGLGELFVWLFFGLIAVGGSYYLQAGLLSAAALVAGAIIGMPAAAVLVVNNYRDLDNDRKVGKQTLAVTLGRRVSRVEYTLLMLLPFVLFPFVYDQRTDEYWWFLPWLALPWAIVLIRRFWSEPPGPAFNQILAATARFQFVFGLLLCSSFLADPAFLNGV